TLGNAGVQDVLKQRLAVLGLVGVRLLLGFEVNRGAIVGGADGARQEGAVVARIIPSEPAFVHRLLPQGDREFDRLDRLLAVQRDGFLVVTDLPAAPRPEIGVPPAGSVTEGMHGGLPERPALGLHFLPGVAVFVPGSRELAVLVADLL